MALFAGIFPKLPALLAVWRSPNGRHVRWMTTELAWSGLRYQPESALSVWFKARYGNGGKRLRRIGIVAGARKLLIALWRFLKTGVLPEGAVLKEA